MALRTRSRMILAKIESVFGSDPTPTPASNAVLVKDPKVNYQGDLLERLNVTTSLSPDQPIVGKRVVEVTFEAELKGSGSYGVAPQIGALLQACGFAETFSGGSSSVTYTPKSSDIKSVTIYVYDLPDASGNVKRHVITGCRGNVVFTFEAGQYVKCAFTFRGQSSIPTDVSDPGDGTYESTIPPILESASFTLNSDSDLIVQQLTIDMGNELADEDDFNSAGGNKGTIITGRKPNGSFNPEAVLAATYDFHTDWAASTARALAMQLGTTAKNRCTITAPKVTLDAISDGDRNGILTNDIPIHLSRSSVDDEVSFVFD